MKAEDVERIAATEQRTEGHDFRKIGNALANGIRARIILRCPLIRAARLFGYVIP